MSIFTRATLWDMLSTIKSPVFRELVLEMPGQPDFGSSFPEHQGGLDRTSSIREEQFAEREDFRFIIRTGVLDDQETFQRFVKEACPSLARQGGLLFETSDLVKCPSLHHPQAYHP